MNENRRSIRRRVLQSATIEFDCGAYSCAVRNLSEAGAALDVPHALAIPHEFTLIMETDQAPRQCRVIWRKENRLGVAFAEQVDCQPARCSKSSVIDA
jgi:PilZ domain